MKERMSPSTLFDEIQRRAPFWREKLPEIPDLVYQALKNDNKKQRLLEEQVSLLKQQMLTQNSQHRRIIYGISGTACLVSGMLLNATTLNNSPLDLVLIATGISLLLVSFRKD